MNYDYSMEYCAEYAISLFRYLKHLNKKAVLLGPEEELRAEFTKQGSPINEEALLSIKQMYQELEEDYLLI